MVARASHIRGERLVTVVGQLATLADRGEAHEIARALAHVAEVLRTDRNEGIRELTMLYGGTGSLNDLVLYRAGQSLVDENREFDALRSQLFDAMVALRGGK